MEFYSWPTQRSMKFVLSINSKMPTFRDYFTLYFKVLFSTNAKTFTSALHSDCERVSYCIAIFCVFVIPLVWASPGPSIKTYAGGTQKNNRLSETVHLSTTTNVKNDAKFYTQDCVYLHVGIPRCNKHSLIIFSRQVQREKERNRWLNYWMFFP